MIQLHFEHAKNCRTPLSSFSVRRKANERHQRSALWRDELNAVDWTIALKWVSFRMKTKRTASTAPALPCMKCSKIYISGCSSALRLNCISINKYQSNTPLTGVDVDGVIGVPVHIPIIAYQFRSRRLRYISKAIGEQRFAHLSPESIHNRSTSVFCCSTETSISDGERETMASKLRLCFCFTGKKKTQ